MVTVNGVLKYLDGLTMLSITSTLHYREEENELHENNFPHTQKKRTCKPLLSRLQRGVESSCACWVM